jgi:VirE-like protein
MSTITPTQQPNCTAATGTLSLNGKTCVSSAEDGNPASTILVSCVKNAKDTVTQHYDAKEIIESIRTDKPFKLRPLKLGPTIEQIRKMFADFLANTGDRKAAKNAVNDDKKQLPAVMWSGRFRSRKKNALDQHSGLLCADLDELGDQITEVRSKLVASSHVWALFTSPTGDGLKCVFRVQADADKHKQSFRAVEEHVHALTGAQIDQACSDVARLCFFSYDPDTYSNEAAIELEPLETESSTPTAAALCAPEIKMRRDIAEQVLGKIDWETETQGNCTCPGEHLHTTPTENTHCQVLVDGAPTIRCFHNHCKSILKGVNHELRSRIGKAEHAANLQMQNASNNRPKVIHAHYDTGRKCYWTQNSRGGWIEINEQSLRRLLKRHGFNATPAQGQRLSEVDQKLSETQLEQDVAYAGPLAGHRSGVLECYGNRILVTTSPKLIEPTAGEWPMLNRFLENLLVDGSYDQRPCVYAWLKLAYEALRAEQRRPGPVMAIAGPRNSGKSLLQNLFTEILGGRVAKPYRYMSGHTDFNGELFGAEHLMVEDEAPSTDLRSRRALGAHIKAFTVNETQSCHVKNRQALTLSPFWRVSISVNDEPENLMILPPISDSEHDSLGDKIILLRANLAEMPKPTETLEQYAIFWQTLMSELPAFLDFLLHWEVPTEMRHPRYGMKTWHHPELLLALDALAPETRLLSLIDETLFTDHETPGNLITSSKAKDLWQGTAEQLERLLCDNPTVGYEARKLLSWPTACGTYLGRLSKKHPPRVQQGQRSDARRWILRRAGMQPAVVGVAA